METEKIIKPDLNNLRGYFNYSEEDILRVKTDGIQLKSDYFNEEFYIHVAERFEKIASQYFIYGHYDELLYLIWYYNENMEQYEEAIWQNYKDDKISKEVANFLLAFRRNENVGEIQLAIKDSTGTHTIKDKDVSQWMCKLISRTQE